MGSLRSTARAAVACALCAAGVRAADIDVMLVPGDRIELEMGGGGTVTGVVAGVAGQRLTLRAKRGPRSGVEPALYLARPDGTPFDAGPRSHRTKSAATLRAVPLDTTGPWRVTLAALAGGGSVRFSVAGAPPRRAVLAGELGADAPTGAHALDVLPGSSVRVRARSVGKPSWTPTVEIESPSGAPLTVPTSKAAGWLVLDEAGRHTLRVTGGSGRYALRVDVKPPKTGHRELTFRDVELRPRIDDVSPLVLQNDAQPDLRLTGPGFTKAHRVALRRDGKNYAATPVTEAFANDARIALDTTGLVPGPYQVQASTPLGNVVLSDETIEIVNRPPTLSSLSAPEFALRIAAPVEIVGRGFDADCEVTVTRTSDGLPMDVELAAARDDRKLRATLRPQPFAVGTYDVVLRDPSGESRTYPRAIDTFGMTGPQADVFAHDGPHTFGYVFPISAAYDATRGNVCAAVYDDGDLVFVLFEAQSLTVLDTRRITGGGRLLYPQLAWSPVDDAFAVSYVQLFANSALGFVRIWAADDLDDERAQSIVASDDDVTLVDVAADPEVGGFLVAWEQWDSVDGSKVYTLRHSASAPANLTTKSLVYAHTQGYAWAPRVCYRGARTFVVAYIGSSPSDTAYAIRRSVTSAAGLPLGPSVVVAADTNWYSITAPHLVRNPHDDSVLLGFSYLVQSAWHPAFTILDAQDVEPGPVVGNDLEGILAEGFIDSAVWGEDRGEFLLGLSDTTATRAVVRRISPDGTPHIAYLPESYEGMVAVLWAGPTAGTVGLLRGYDGDDDDYIDWWEPVGGHVRAGRMR